MDEILKHLSETTGINLDQAKAALAAVLVFIKEHVPADLFTHVEKSLPGAQGLISTAEETPADSGGLMGALTGLAGKIFGGGGVDVAKLLALLNKSGLSLEQVQKFIPMVIEVLKKYLPPEVLEKILKAIPGLLGAAKGA